MLFSDYSIDLVLNRILYSIAELIDRGWGSVDGVVVVGDGSDLLKSFQNQFKMVISQKDINVPSGHDTTVDEDVYEPPVQDLALNVDNVFQADDCDAFDSDVDEAPTAQTMFMENLSSADPVDDEVSPSYDSDILSKVPDHDSYQYAVCDHHEVHEMHDDDVLKMKAKALKEQTTALRPIKVLTVYPPNTPATLVPKNLRKPVKRELYQRVSLKGKGDLNKPRNVISPRYAIDVKPIPPRSRNNREVHLDYLKHLKESVETLRKIVKEAKVERPLDRSLASACLYTKNS
ncbi:hypothetical protein Tco_0698630 [Tanacetum coccineum]